MTTKKCTYKVLQLKQSLLVLIITLVCHSSSQNFYYHKKGTNVCDPRSKFSNYYAQPNPYSLEQKYWKYYTNPVVSFNSPDPGILVLPNNKGYIVVTTSDLAENATTGAFRILHSKDLVNWATVRTLFCRLVEQEMSKISSSFFVLRFSEGFRVSQGSMAELGVPKYVGTRDVPPQWPLPVVLHSHERLRQSTLHRRRLLFNAVRALSRPRTTHHRRAEIHGCHRPVSH